MKITSLPGLNPDQTARLQEAGIGSCQQLLRTSRREERLQALQQSTGLSPETLEDIKQQAELSQIRGIGPAALADLLDSGVTSVGELASQEPEAIQHSLRAATDRSRNLAVIESWILQARRQPNNHADVLAQNHSPA
jgi:predicted flap endonuclease-1-like 5' DNA nuclease